MSEGTARLRIAMIGCKGLPVRKDSGGIERHVEQIATRLVEAGHRVVCFVRPRFTGTKERTWNGIRLVRLPSIPTKNLDTFTHTFFASIAVLFRRVDVIHYHGVGPATLAWIPRLCKPSARVIVTVHSIDRLHQKWGLFARLYLRLGEWAAMRFPHKTICVSRSLQHYFLDVYGEKLEYVPNGAVVGDYPGSDLIKKRWELKKGGYLLTVARLIKLKGIHHLIEAYGGLETDKKLVIVGTSPLGSEYGEYLKQMSRGNSGIIFTGFQSGRVLAQLYANCFLYVHPSEVEGLSLAILEAMSYGRCVLVSDIPENMESIDHSGLTFTNADAEDLRGRLVELLNHPELVEERGDRASSWIARNYDWDKIVAATVRVYWSVR